MALGHAPSPDISVDSPSEPVELVKSSGSKSTSRPAGPAAGPTPAGTASDTDRTAPALDIDATATAVAPALAPVVPVSSRKVRAPRWLRRTLGPLALLGLWQLLSATGVLEANILASPGTVASVGRDLTVDGTLPAAMSISLQRVAVGLFFGTLIGTLLALASGLFRLGEDLVDAAVQMLRTVPFVGLIPLFIIWFGIGEAPKIAVITLGVTFPLYLNVYAAIRSVDAQLIEAGESLGLSRWGLVRHVVLPGALPGAMTGLRYSLGVAWLGLVFAEQINADSGLGFVMVQARDFLRTDVIVVCLVVYAFLGLAADLIVRTLERLLLQWRPTFTGR